MTLADARPAGPRHALPEPSTSAWFERYTPAVPAQRVPEPPAGLGPWVPALPAPEPILSRRVWAWIGTVAVALVLGTTALVAVGVHGKVTATETTYVASVRANSSLTAVDVTDGELVADGRAVCSTLDAHPSRSALIGAFATLTQTTGWSADDAAAVVGSAIGAFCPQHRALIGR